MWYCRTVACSQIAPHTGDIQGWELATGRYRPRAAMPEKAVETLIGPEQLADKGYIWRQSGTNKGFGR